MGFVSDNCAGRFDLQTTSRNTIPGDFIRLV